MHDLVIRNGTIVDGTGAAPSTGDVAIDGGTLTAVGTVDGTAHRTIDADGAVVAPGWVDIHTHYDGQVSWDPVVAPSSEHGVTTVVMGNCGVGFAPARPDGHDFLIELMEGVEDIPGTALHEGIDWQWESFGEYLDALARTGRTIDIAGQVPHAAVRAYVMGERAHEDPDAAEIAEIASVVAQGIRQGAVGFSTSRTILHTSRHGLVPGTMAAPDELIAIADAMAGVGRGVFQFVSDHQGMGDDQTWMADIADRTGVPITYSLAQTPFAPTAYRDALDEASARSAAGQSIIPQVPARPTGMLFGLQSSFHPFMAHPSYRPLWTEPLEARVGALRDPELRARLVAEAPQTHSRSAAFLATAWHQMYRLGDPPDYEPPAGTSAQAVADREGRSPQEVVLDWLLEDEGRAFLFSPLGSYVDQDHEAIRTMLEHPAAVAGLGDGGAHCSLICDASFPTYLLTHWVRDRRRGARIPIETAVRLQTSATADTYGFADRGRLQPGTVADVNVIDLDGLTLHAPQMIHDLPAGGQRLVQPVDGYVATIKSGQVTFEDGNATGARPGAVLRSTG